MGSSIYRKPPWAPKIEENGLDWSSFDLISWLAISAFNAFNAINVSIFKAWSNLNQFLIAQTPIIGRERIFAMSASSQPGEHNQLC